MGGSGQMGYSSGYDSKDYTKNAYMLIYEKRIKKEIKVVLPQ